MFSASDGPARKRYARAAVRSSPLRTRPHCCETVRNAARCPRSVGRRTPVRAVVWVERRVGRRPRCLYRRQPRPFGNRAGNASCAPRDPVTTAHCETNGVGRENTRTRRRRRRRRRFARAYGIVFGRRFSRSNTSGEFEPRTEELATILLFIRFEPPRSFVRNNARDDGFYVLY